MAQSQFSLAWESHNKNLSTGLSSLQQNNEFVDMTLAADGHFVKVHQVIIALSSPYFKDLLASAPCQHPVVFLNKISYTTLNFILEYIYTGEVYINVENLVELAEAARELRIKGLEDMKLPETSYQEPNHEIEITKQFEEYNDEKGQVEVLEDDTCYLEVSDINIDEKSYVLEEESYSVIENEEHLSQSEMDHTYEDNKYREVETEIDTNCDEILLNNETPITSPKTEKKSTVLQYTVSNQGSLQMILNRFIYYLKHTNKNQSQQWRCLDYLTSKKCPAYIITRNGVIILRISAHNHIFHDRRILKKVRAGIVFSALSEAQERGKDIKENKFYIEPNNSDQ